MTLFLRGLVDFLIAGQADPEGWEKAADRRRKIAADALDPQKRFPGSPEDAERFAKLATDGIEEFELRAKRWEKVKKEWVKLRAGDLSDKALSGVVILPT